jgi:hypothetical protein
MQPEALHAIPALKNQSFSAKDMQQHTLYMCNDLQATLPHHQNYNSLKFKNFCTILQILSS